MSGPARAGLFIYAADPERLADFYLQMLGMVRVRTTAELVILNSPDLQIVVHAMPGDAAAESSASSPPVRREAAAFKFFHTVPSISALEPLARALGGEILAEQWRGPGFIVRNAVDPEGNIFQLREFAA